MSLPHDVCSMQARTFPGHQEKKAADVKPLNSYPAHVQERVLLRELLLALCGIEGVYIRVGAEDVDGKKLSSLKHIAFHIDADSSECLSVQVLACLSLGEVVKQAVVCSLR